MVVANPYLFVLTRWARDKGVALGGLDGLRAHFERFLQDEDVQTALEEEGLKGSNQSARPEE